MRIWILIVTLLLVNCASYIIEKRQFGLEENISVEGRILKIDTLRNGDGVIKEVIVERKQ